MKDLPFADAIFQWHQASWIRRLMGLRLGGENGISHTEVAASFDLKVMGMAAADRVK